MSRIRKLYRTRFERSLKTLGVRKMDKGLDWWNQEIYRRQRDLSFTHACIAVEKQLEEKVQQFIRRCRSHANSRYLKADSSVDRDPEQDRPERPTRFLCDAGLGGLCRWLRAAGYESLWTPGISDDDLLREAPRLEATILTTDSGLMERRLLRDRLLPALWLPSSLTIPDQLALVFRQWHLEVRAPRCMTCGGELQRVEKETVRARIPPKTWRWLDEYYLCRQCDHLFWRGTHWQQISQRLKVSSRQ